MVKYDPNNELSEKELDEIAENNFDEFLDYLDQKSEYLKQFTKPLSSYHTKRFASLDAAMKGEKLTDSEFESAAKIGKDNEQKVVDKIVEKNWKEEGKELLKKTGVKNVKSRRDEWFD